MRSLLWEDGEVNFGLVVVLGCLRGAAGQSVSEGGRNFCDPVGIGARVGMVAKGNI